MRVLVLNCGSSSVKFQLVEPDAPGGVRRPLRGLVERIGADAVTTVDVDGAPAVRERAAIRDHAAAVHRCVEAVRGAALPVDAVGHRVVHGGDRFSQPVLLDEAAEAAIEELHALAPLHNAPSLAGIRAARAVLGRATPMVAVFDTAFHATLPEHAARYAIPWELAERHRIRRYGFHGTSYRSVLSTYCTMAGTPLERATLVALHLGNGCSAAAIHQGRSVDTSMGFTPLEGLVMGTRAGDLDPAIVGHLAQAEGVGVETVEQWLNDRSGLLGLSGRSPDMRELLAHESHEPRARLALEIFCYRARKYIGAYLAALGGADAVVFTGGIGEHAAEIRARICAGMEWCGLVLDPARNTRTVGEAGWIGAEGVRLRVAVIPTDEELVIAQDTAACLKGRAR